MSGSVCAAGGAVAETDPPAMSLPGGDEARGGFGFRFRFRRYREELALRQRKQGKVRLQDQPDGFPDAPNGTAPGEKASNDGPGENDRKDDDDDGGGTVLRDLSGARLVVDENGSVSVSFADTEGGPAHGIPSMVPEGTTLLLRNLRDCRVAIHLPLPAVHLVGIRGTEVDFFNGGSGVPSGGSLPTNTTIHVTDCHGGSVLRFERPAQQLRIHGSIGLGIGVAERPGAHRGAASTTPASSPDRQWKPGSIILEASRDLCFTVPPIDHHALEADTRAYWHGVVVRDFHWLRKGVPSPNFRVEVLGCSPPRGEGPLPGEERGPSGETNRGEDSSDDSDDDEL